MWGAGDAGLVVNSFAFILLLCMFDGFFLLFRTNLALDWLSSVSVDTVETAPVVVFDP